MFVDNPADVVLQAIKEDLGLQSQGQVVMLWSNYIISMSFSFISKLCKCYSCCISCVHILAREQYDYCN